MKIALFANSLSTACAVIKQDDYRENDYNPNNVAPPEKRLLCKSLEMDGFTQPHCSDGKARPGIMKLSMASIGMKLGPTSAVLKRQFKGYLPVTCLRKERQKSSTDSGHHSPQSERAAATKLMRCPILSGRAGAFAGTTRESVRNWEWIATRYCASKQINGLLELFADRRYSRSPDGQIIRAR